MDTFKDRLRRAADYAGVEFAPQPIARSLGIARRQTVARWLEGSVPEQEMIFHIASAWKVDPVWLGTGAGDMYPKTPTGLTQRELELLQTYRQLDSAKRSSVFSIVRALAKAVVVLVITTAPLHPPPDLTKHLLLDQAASVLLIIGQWLKAFIFKVLEPFIVNSLQRDNEGL